MNTILKSLIGFFLLVLLTNVASAQTATTPYAGATYTYKVQAESLSNTITWTVWDGSTDITSQCTLAITDDGTFSFAEITWGLGLTAENVYTVKYTEEANSCTTVRKLDVTYKANNTFDVTIAASNATQCNTLHNVVSDLNDDATTTVTFTVSMAKDAAWSIDSWKYKFAINLTGSGTPTVSEVRILGTGVVTEVSGKYANSGVTAGVSRTIEVDVIGDANSAITVALQLSEAFAVNGIVDTAEVSPDVNTNDASTVIKALPAATAITF